MVEIKSKHYRKSRRRNFFRHGLKKMLQMGTLVVVGEYLLISVIKLSLSEQNPLAVYRNMPTRIINLAVNEKPILRAAEAYRSIKKNVDFDQILSSQYPAQVKGARPDFRTVNLQDKEGAKVGYKIKF